jgi:hypothetical protein
MVLMMVDFLLTMYDDWNNHHEDHFVMNVHDWDVYHVDVKYDELEFQVNLLMNSDFLLSKHQ